MKFSFEELVKATKSQVIFSTNQSGMFEISTDSRQAKNINVYLPIKGENFDGHNFIENAIENGARGYFTSNKSKIVKNAKFALFVKDTKIAFLELAAYAKSKIKPITIAITGSSGKTTTKEMAYSVFNEKFKTHKSPLNHNNEVGFCQTLLSMPTNTEVLIVEMGMRGLGEIELLSKYAQPDISIITNVGTAHLERLKTQRNIAKAKCEIISHAHIEGLLIANNDDLIKKENKFKGKTKYFSIKDTKIISQNKNSVEFIYKLSQYKLNVSGEYNVENAIAVIEAGLKFGLSPQFISKGLEKYSPIEKRWEETTVNGFHIINDSYNANPESMKAALKTFLTNYQRPLVLVLGDMGELGSNSSALHSHVGDFLNKFKYDVLICVGKLARNIYRHANLKTVNFLDNKECTDYILNNIDRKSTLFFKASRAMKFEEIIEGLKK